MRFVEIEKLRFNRDNREIRCFRRCLRQNICLIVLSIGGRKEIEIPRYLELTLNEIF